MLGGRKRGPAAWRTAVADVFDRVKQEARQRKHNLLQLPLEMLACRCRHVNFPLCLVENAAISYVAPSAITGHDSPERQGARKGLHTRGVCAPSARRP